MELSISDRIKPKLLKYLSKHYEIDGYYVDSIADPRYYIRNTSKNITHNAIIRDMCTKTGYSELDILLLLEKWILSEGKNKKQDSCYSK